MQKINGKVHKTTKRTAKKELRSSLFKHIQDHSTGRDDEAVAFMSRSSHGLALLGALIVMLGGIAEVGTSTLGEEMEERPENVKSSAWGGAAMAMRFFGDIVAARPRLSTMLCLETQTQPKPDPNDKAAEDEKMAEHLDVLTFWSQTRLIDDPDESKTADVTAGG